MNYKVLEILPLREGDTEKGHYRNQDIVVESDENVQFPDRFLLTLRGSNVDKLADIKVGDVITAEWSSNVRDWKTRDGNKAYSQQHICWRLSLATETPKEDEDKPF